MGLVAGVHLEGHLIEAAASCLLAACECLADR
jgi:hypothetical protein